MYKRQVFIQQARNTDLIDRHNIQSYIIAHFHNRNFFAAFSQLDSGITSGKASTADHNIFSVNTKLMRFRDVYKRQYVCFPQAQ